MSLSDNSILYRYYRQGRDAEESGFINDAISSYISYSEHLNEKDQHIPFLWIAKLYMKKGDFANSIESLKTWSSQTSPTFAAEVIKDLGERSYAQIKESSEYYTHTISLFEMAIDCNPNIGLKKRLKKLKESKGGII
jgi:tetratricopeptide (TPR) repeat protein